MGTCIAGRREARKHIVKHESIHVVTTVPASSPAGAAERTVGTLDRERLERPVWVGTEDFMSSSRSLNIRSHTVHYLCTRKTNIAYARVSGR